MDIIDMPEGPAALTGATVAKGERLHWGARTYVVGVINVTPDSFSGDGLGSNVLAAVEQALRFEGEGADILDVGAESTRPGHQQVSEAEELGRLLPPLEAIADRVSIPVSVDTWKAGVAAAALEAGARIVNDVWGMRGDPDMAATVAGRGAGAVLMHNQQGCEYGDLLGDVVAGLRSSIALALKAGVRRECLVVDPGIGFGKTADQNLELLRELHRLRELELPVLVGTSRKSTIGRLLGLPPDQRVEGTAATVALAIAGGADLVRVHDVGAMVRVCRVADAVVRGWRPEGWRAAP